MIQITKTSEKSIIPTRGSQFSAGYDIFSIEDSSTLQPLERKLFKTGICIKIPDGYYGRIAPRSGISLKQGIDVMAGVIDSDYIGEIGIILVNLSNIPVVVNTINSIAQLIIEKYYNHEFEVVETLQITQRGEGGFGSTDHPSLTEIIETIQSTPTVAKLQPLPELKYPVTEYPGVSGPIISRYQRTGGIPIKKKYSDEIKEREQQ